MSATDRIKQILEIQAEVTELRVAVKASMDDLQDAWADRDAARAEVERLRELAQNYGKRNGWVELSRLRDAVLGLADEPQTWMVASGHGPMVYVEDLRALLSEAGESNE